MTLDCTKKVIQEDQPNTDVDGKNEIQEDQDELTHSNKMGCVPREFQLIGREKEKSDIIELIRELSSIRQFEVIAVWGMSGFGKTTLIKDVCQGQEVNDMFDKTAFVTVLQPFRLEGLLRSLALQLDASKGNIASMGVADLTRVLGRHIKGKSCLIVLDDLPSTTEWDTIMASLGAKGTSSLVIVITTRREDVAKHCCKKPECIRLLNGLEEKDALYLFTRKVFKNKKTDLAREYPKLVVPAKQILNKCIGHPLAIISIGSFLGSQPQKTVAEWRKVNELLSVQLEMYTLFHAIKLVLMKSYDGLPYYLKSCFLYLSIFLEDRNVSRRRLVYRWVAEGYSRDIAVADSYFMKLIERSMILPTQVSHCGVQGIDSCELHDLIREICIATSMEENLVLRLEEGCSLNMHSTVRHLAISSNWDGDETELENTVELSRIRSLTVFGKWRPFYISHKMRFLRVLDLEGVEGLADHHLEHIGKHLHLRYLSLRWCEGITYLPDSIGNLRHLETLDIKGTEIFKLPKTITKLSKLLNLKAGRPSLYPCELHKGAKLLCCIPSRMRFNWRHGACTPFARCIEGYNVGVKVPRGTRKLKALHTLRYVHLAWGNAIIKEIKCLTSLRKLGVVGINNTNGLEFCSAISSLCRLESLSVLAHDSLNGCLDGMCTAPENLQSLKLSGSLEKLPVWIKGLQNLVKLKLQFTTLSCNWAAMETLGYLPYLSILGLHEGESMMDVIRFQSGLFRKLTVLDLLYFSMEIKSVEFEEGSMPKLEVLTLFLEDTETAFFGLEHLRSIKEVRLGVQFNENSTKFSENMSLEEMEKAEEQSKEAEKKTKLVKDKLRKELQIQLHRDENRPILKVE